jgi:hypothetical protein
MPHLLAYLRTNGLIQGVWTAAHPDHLRPNIQASHPTLAYLLVAEDVPDVRLLQERHWVHNGVLQVGTEVTLVATPNPFVADGQTACVIRPEPFVPCTLVVGPFGAQREIVLHTVDDPLILTTETPQVVPIQLSPLAGYWATSLTVEAT